MEDKRRCGEGGREMMDCISAEEAKLADQIAIQELGIPTLKLMERAGKAVAELAASLLPDRSSSLLVLSGVGNNGGDALCAASLLKEDAYSPTVLIVGDLKRGSWEFLYQLSRFYRLGGKPMYYESAVDLPKAELILDGIFGIGLRRELRGDFRELIERVEELKERRVLAIDIPSGICGDNGEKMGAAVPADITISFGKWKTGLLYGEGKRYSGEVRLAEIGIPEEAYREARRRLREAGRG